FRLRLGNARWLLVGKGVDVNGQWPKVGFVLNDLFYRGWMNLIDTMRVLVYIHHEAMTLRK
ncbi:hypothetical protein CGI47_25360, partial [Vibrio parahaemolyticus]